MGGVRVHHPRERACTLVVPHPGDPATGRRPKDYYIRLDSDGNSIVSPTVWRRLEEARGAGWPHDLTVVNIVAAPPGIRLHLGTKSRDRAPLVHVGRNG